MKGIRMLFMDVDGTLTDGKIYMGSSGEICKAFDIKDGCGIRDILPQYDIIPVILTARQSQIVTNRCEELGIRHIYQNCREKTQKMTELSAQFGILPDEQGYLQGIAYIGDDILDLPCMELAELAGCPADAVDEVKAVSHFISRKNGGCGAVREFIEWICIGE